MGTDEEVAHSLNIKKLMNDENESVASTNSTNSNMENDLEGSGESDSEDEMEEGDSSDSESEKDNESQKSAEDENTTSLMGVTESGSVSFHANEKDGSKSIELIKGAEENVDDVTSESESDEENDEAYSEHETSSEDEGNEKNNSILTSAEKDEEQEKSGWADAMAKVLNMGKNTAQTEPNKPLFLSKAIKDSEIKQRSAAGSKDIGSENNNTKEEKPPTIRSAIRRAQKKEMEEKGRSKPDIVKDRSKEKMLCKLATKGVVQLFNAVRDQQKSIKTQLNTAGGSVRKREKVYQNIDRQSFLNVLTNQKSVGGDSSSNSNETLIRKSSIPTNLHTVKRSRIDSRHNEIKTEEDEIKAEAQDIEDCSANESTWSVFRDDFMMGAKMKDWDKEESESDE